MDDMIFSSNTISLSFHLDTGKFTLNWPLSAKWRGQEFVVPSGFETDLASIPRRLRSVVAQVGRHMLPAIFHDAAYEGHFGDMTKAEADQMFLDGMEAVDVPWVRRKVMYAAVRVGGRGHWKE